MMKKKGYKVSPAMFDVRPTTKTGNFLASKKSAWNKVIKIPKTQATASIEKTTIPSGRPNPLVSKSQKKIVTPPQPTNSILTTRPKLIQLNHRYDPQAGIPSLIKSSYVPMTKRMKISDISHGRNTISLRDKNIRSLKPRPTRPIILAKNSIHSQAASVKPFENKPKLIKSKLPSVAAIQPTIQPLILPQAEKKVEIISVFKNQKPKQTETNLNKVTPPKAPALQNIPIKICCHSGDILPQNIGVADDSIPLLENILPADQEPVFEKIFIPQQIDKSQAETLFTDKQQGSPKKSLLDMLLEQDDEVKLQPVEIKKPVLKNKASKKQFRFFSLLSANYNQLIDPLELKKSWQRNFWRPALSFTILLLFCSSLFGSILLASRGWQLKDRILVKGQQALGQIAEAKTEIKDHDFEGAGQKFEQASAEFSDAQKQLDQIGGDLLNIFSQLPYLSKVSSGKNLIDAGQNLTQAAQKFSQVAATMSQLENPLKPAENGQGQSLVETMKSINDQVSDIQFLLENAQNDIKRVNIQDLPEDYRPTFQKIQKTLPLINRTLAAYNQNQQIYLDILGHNGPRKYLFLFQNNQEMRATGGFIGSYGILDINNGHLKNLFIDGIYNPDGQLKELVVPPKPIQKMSGAWSMHDSNWFPSFPVSAEKAAWFYEKTGGPTVDGVIAITPTVLQKMLEITGPIEMPEYDSTVDKDNFIEKTQYEVEIDYDKELNKPKQFIADLAPKILDQVLSVRDPKQLSQVFRIFSTALKEKHILIYSNNYDLEKIISEQGWGGEIKQTDKDFLMVINTNINGYKTDGVIDETISHQAEIQADGSIVNTLKIRREHHGGDTDYEWWNKVNADYMRVYVPQGSRLISVTGQTREFNQPPLNYDELGFRHDPQVSSEEQNMLVDEETGTRIYDEENKTVFANWVYVSPKEVVEIEYKYTLPFKLDLHKNPDSIDSYSLLVQKQSGSIGSKFESTISLAENMNLIWKYPEGAENKDKSVIYSSDLIQDRFIGLVIKGLK